LKNPIYEIESDKVVELMELLEKQNFVSETSIFGNNIHVIVNKNFSNVLQINNLTNDAGIKINRINKIVPTLEDVFIHLLEEIKPETR